MNSHLTLSLKPIYSTPFPLITYMCGRLYMELWESLVLPRYYKWDVVKIRQASHGLTETRQKGHWKMMLYQGGERKIHTLEISGHVQMAKSDPEAQRKSSLSDCTWFENEYGSFNLEALKFLMHFREPGSSLYFYFCTYSYFFLISYFSFFLSFSHFFFFFFLIEFFICSPSNFKIASYLPPPPCLDVARPRAKRW
jgi:hypothetical protein